MPPHSEQLYQRGDNSKDLEVVIIAENIPMDTCMGTNSTPNQIAFFHVAQVHFTSYVSH